MGLYSHLSRWNMGYMEIFFIIYPKPYSIYLRGTIGLRGFGFEVWASGFRVQGLEAFGLRVSGVG